MLTESAYEGFRDGLLLPIGDPAGWRIGDTVMLLGEEKGTSLPVVMSRRGNGIARATAETVPSKGVFFCAALDASALTLIPTKDGITLYDALNGGYLSADSANGGRLRTKTLYDASGVWQIGFLPDGTALLQTLAAENYVLQYSNGAFVFKPFDPAVTTTGVRLAIESDWIVRNGGMAIDENDAKRFYGILRIETLQKAASVGDEITFGLQLSSERYSIRLTVKLVWSEEMAAAAPKALAELLRLRGLVIDSITDTEITYRIEANPSEIPYTYTPFVTIGSMTYYADGRTGDE